MRARRAAPRNTLSSVTVTPRNATDPTLRDVSSGSSALTVTPSVVASTTTTSSPAISTSTSASGAPSTAGISPVTSRSDPTTALPDNPSAPTVVPSASPGSSSSRSESDPHRSITSDAATRRQERSRTQLATLRLEHYRQFRQPEARTAVFFGKGEAQPAQVAPPPSIRRRGGRIRLPTWRGRPPCVDSRVNWPVAASARSGCSSVMASADLLTLEVLLPLTGVRKQVNPHSGRPPSVTGVTFTDLDVRLVNTCRMLSFGGTAAGYIRPMTDTPDCPAERARQYGGAPGGFSAQAQPTICWR